MAQGTSLTWSNVTGGSSLSARANITGTTVTDINTFDFNVVDSGGRIASGWSISISTISASASRPLTVTATPTVTVNGNFAIQWRGRSSRTQGSRSNNFPASDSTSTTALVQRTFAVVATVTWGTLTGGTTLSAPITFSGAAVTGIQAGDFSVRTESGSIDREWSIAVSSSSASAGGSVTVTATPTMAKSGKFRFAIHGTSVMSGGSSTNNAPRFFTQSSVGSAAQVDFTPRMVASASWSGISGGTNLSGTLTFSGADVTHIEADDFDVVNSADMVDPGWSIVVSADHVSAGGTVTVTATPTVDKNGSFKIRLKSMTVRSDGSTTDNAPTDMVPFATAQSVNFSAPANATWSNILGGDRITGTINFSGASISDLAPINIAVLDASNQIDSDWTIEISSSSAVDGGTINVIATPSYNRRGNYKLRLLAMSFNSGTGTDNVPLADVDSPAASIIFPPVVPVVPSWSGTSGGVNLKGRISFNNSHLVNMTADNYEVRDSDGPVDNWFIAISATNTSGSRNYIDVVANPPKGVVSGEFMLVLKANVLHSSLGPVSNSIIISPSIMLGPVAPVVPTAPTEQYQGFTEYEENFDWFDRPSNPDSVHDWQVKGKNIPCLVIRNLGTGLTPISLFPTYAAFSVEGLVIVPRVPIDSTALRVGLIFIPSDDDYTLNQIYSIGDTAFRSNRVTAVSTTGNNQTQILTVGDLFASN